MRQYCRRLAVGLLLAAVGLLTWSYVLSASKGRALLAEVVEPADFKTGVTVGAFDAAGSEDLRLEASAAIDNAWTSVRADVVDQSGAVIGSWRINLEYYHGVKDGEPWVTGSQHQEQRFMIGRDGPHKLRISAIAGGGASSDEDFTYARPLRVTLSSAFPAFRLQLVIGAMCLIVGFSMLLKSYQPARAEPSLPAATTAGEGAGKVRYLFLDGLRGAAALAVVFCHLLVPEISHYAGALKEAMPSWASHLIRRGDLGVEIFFVLSGFVIAFSIRDRRVTPGFAGRFALRRSLRLDPPYYIVIAMTIMLWAYFLPTGLAGAFDEIHGATGVLVNMAYLQRILEYPAPVGVAWTLCLEVQFYLAFIVLTGLAQTVYRTLPGGGAEKNESRRDAESRLIVFLPLGIYSLYTWYPALLNFHFFGAWFRFFMGVLIYWAISGKVSRWWLFAFLAATAALAIVHHDERGIAATLTAGVIFGVASYGKLETWLAAPWLQFLGRISYSLYLIHVVVGMAAANVLWSLTDHTPAIAFLCAAAGVVTSIAAGYALHRAVESPSVEISKRVSYGQA